MSGRVTCADAPRFEGACLEADHRADAVEFTHRNRATVDFEKFVNSPRAWSGASEPKKIGASVRRGRYLQRTQTSATHMRGR